MTARSQPRVSVRRLRTAAPALIAAMLVLTGCAGGGSWPGSGTPVSTGSTQAAEPPGGPATAATNAPGGDTTDPPASSAPRPAVDSCDWDAPATAGATSDAPSGQQGELRNVIVGAWQHTHFDSGQGLEATSQDIRYVFPSDGEVLYCQHVPGVTDHAEIRGPITWEGTTIVMPGGAVKYTVTEWSESSMLWLNHFDNSTYLLVRR